MTDRPRHRDDASSADEAPELHNAEQDDEGAQAHTLADEALAGGARDASPLDSIKVGNDDDLMDDSTQDLVDKMRDMEQSGRIDMGAFRGEPNHDDEDETYGYEVDSDDE
jgi:hypothetical protein